MPFVATLHVYSQRRDPSWILSDPQVRDLRDLVSSLQIRTPFKARGFPSRLGYRGFSIASAPPALVGLQLTVSDAIVDPGPDRASLFDPERTVERWLLSSAKDDEIKEAAEDVQQSLARPAKELLDERDKRLVFRPPLAECIPRAVDAPIYDEAPWNTPPALDDNNCYNYANNQVLGKPSVPGAAHGVTIKNCCDCALRGALKDGLVEVQDFSAPLSAGQGWYVALAVRPGRDCHWYRQDASGCWSHKPGSDELRYWDDDYNIITDPRTCNRGPYDFCALMVTKKGIKID